MRTRCNQVLQVRRFLNQAKPTPNNATKQLTGPRRLLTWIPGLKIARFLLIGHWYGTLVTVGVLIVLYLLHKLLLRYPLLDTLFPWCCDNWWCAGWRPEFMGKFKQCHLELDFSGRAPNMCITTQCPCWKWKRPKVHWKAYLFKRRGGCNHSRVR